MVAAGHHKQDGSLYRASGFWLRLVGGLIDLVFIKAAALVLFWGVSQAFDLHFPGNRKTGLPLWFDIDYWLDILLAGDAAIIAWLTIFMATMTVYVFLFQVLWSRTPGMQVTKSVIIDEYGASIKVTTALRRTLGYLLGVATFGLGFLWIGFDIEHRGLHDWLARTYVVQERV